MRFKLNWTQEEDLFLKTCTQTQDRKNWVQISSQINVRFFNKKRTSKQCRERYINHASLCAQNKNKWSHEQCEKLFTVFDQIGAKWSKIATYFIGKGQNCVKNKFYSCIRKLIRRMNGIEETIHGTKVKKLKYQSVFRILQASESIKSLTEEFKQRVLQLRHKIIQFLLGSIQNKHQQIISLIRQINKFNLDSRSYKEDRNKIYKLSNGSLPQKFISSKNFNIYYDKPLNQREMQDNSIYSQLKNFNSTQNSKILQFCPTFQLCANKYEILNCASKKPSDELCFVLDDEINQQQEENIVQKKLDIELNFNTIFENQKNFMGY